MNELKLALRVDDLDNVATIFAEGVTDGTEVVIHDKKGNKDQVHVIGDVPYGHTASPSAWPTSTSKRANMSISTT